MCGVPVWAVVYSSRVPTRFGRHRVVSKCAASASQQMLRESGGALFALTARRARLPSGAVAHTTGTHLVATPQTVVAGGPCARARACWGVRVGEAALRRWAHARALSCVRAAPLDVGLVCHLAGPMCEQMSALRRTRLKGMRLGCVCVLCSCGPLVPASPAARRWRSSAPPLRRVGRDRRRQHRWSASGRGTRWVPRTTLGRPRRAHARYDCG